jgi:protein TonB
MKTFVLLSLLVVLSFPLAAQNPFGPKPEPVRAIPEEIHEELEEMPVFPGGPSAMQKYLEEHIVRPDQMREICSGTRLIAGFVVEKDGSLSQISIIKSINGCPDFDFEVLRVIKNMPKWEPGKFNGRWARCYYKMPVYID